MSYPSQGMSVDEYQRAALRTAPRNGVDRSANGPDFDNLIWALGLTGEAGEVADYLKKVYGHGHPLDRQKVKKELGDVLWYVAVLANSFGLTLEEVAEANVQKLRERYPAGFSPAASLTRAAE